MYYPIIALEDAIKDVRATKAFIKKSNKFIRDDNVEMIKIDLHIDQLESAIRLLKNSKNTALSPEVYIDIYDKYTSGKHKIQELADQYKVSYKTIQRILRRRLEITSDFGKHSIAKIRVHKTDTEGD